MTDKSFAQLQELMTAAVLANEKRQQEHFILQMRMNDEALFSRITNHRKIFYPANVPAVVMPNDWAQYLARDFAMPGHYVAFWDRAIANVPNFFDGPPYPPRDRSRMPLKEFDEAHGYNSYNGAPRGYGYTDSYGRFLPEDTMPMYARPPEPKQLTSPCGECPFRANHDLRFGHLSVVDKVIRTEQLGKTECHMAQHLTCEGGRRFLAKKPDPIILPTMEAVVVAHSDRPEYFQQMRRVTAVEPPRERCERPDFVEDVTSEIFSTPGEIVPAPKWYKRAQEVMLGDVEAVVGQF